MPKPHPKRRHNIDHVRWVQLMPSNVGSLLKEPTLVCVHTTEILQV